MSSIGPRGPCRITRSVPSVRTGLGKFDFAVGTRWPARSVQTSCGSAQSASGHKAPMKGRSQDTCRTVRRRTGPPQNRKRVRKSMGPRTPRKDGGLTLLRLPQESATSQDVGKDPSGPWNAYARDGPQAARTGMQFSVMSTLLKWKYARIVSGHRLNIQMIRTSGTLGCTLWNVLPIVRVEGALKIMEYPGRKSALR